jgi:hypothetical protein
MGKTTTMIAEGLERASKRSTAMLWAVVVVFIATRFFGMWGAIHFGAPSDVEIAYRRWAVRVVQQDRPPYSDVDIEYPPASLPFVLAPQLPEPTKSGYRVNFVLLMLVIDIAGFIGVLLISKRWGSMLGPWLWVIGVPLLGPFVYLRLDLVPAAATIWALQRSSSDDWLGTGGLLGFGVAAKLYPLLLLPLAFIVCPARLRSRLLIGFGVILVLCFLPFATILGDVSREVIEYHTSRGIQVESLWGSILFIARSGHKSRLILHDFGAHHFVLGSVDLIKKVATLATAAAAGVGVWLAWRSGKSVPELAAISFVTLMLAISVSAVLSPQFFIWVVAMGAVTLCVPNPRVRNQVLMLLPILLITRYIYPTLHPELVMALAFPVGVLWCRNVMLLLTSIFAAARKAETSDEVVPQDPVPVGT